MALDTDKLQEIEESRAASAPTRRATVPALEDILYQALPVLDHGFIRVVDYMGDDAAIVQAARVSYGRGTKQVSNDRGLIRYLMRHSHTSPFEMCELKLHVKLPMFIARQWIRHRTANVNEYSARYSILEDEFYVPPLEDIAAQAVHNRQGRGEALPQDQALAIRLALEQHGPEAYALYQRLLNQTADGKPLDPEQAGLARELARIVLPVSAYTQWYWKIDLHNLLHFVGLRADAHAQAEIRAYALVLRDIIQRWVPHTLAAFDDYKLGAATLSAQALEVVRRQLAGEQVEAASSGLAPGEWRELQATLARSARQGT